MFVVGDDVGLSGVLLGYGDCCPHAVNGFYDVVCHGINEDDEGGTQLHRTHTNTVTEP